mmetsp:Transcript_14951/g.24175  ORF Transcript_14951/g.24175 Transcript_14951/m.24175 type:complete len:132 (-) Transcript_14951:81-476(-)
MPRFDDKGNQCGPGICPTSSIATPINGQIHGLIKDEYIVKEISFPYLQSNTAKYIHKKQTMAIGVRDKMTWTMGKSQEPWKTVIHPVLPARSDPLHIASKLTKRLTVSNRTDNKVIPTTSNLGCTRGSGVA